MASDDLEQRIRDIERKMARLRTLIDVGAADSSAARLLAAGADGEVSDVRAQLRAHTAVLNALRQTQVEQGGTLASHGEVLVWHSEVLASHTRTLDQHTRTLDQHTRTLDQHTRTLDQHTRTLDEHGRKLDTQSEILALHSEILDSHTESLQVLDERTAAGFATMDVGMRQIVGLLEDLGRRG